jgi:hypothetical protein
MRRKLTAGDRLHLKLAVKLLSSSDAVEAARGVRGDSSSGEEGEEGKVRACSPPPPSPHIQAPSRVGW